MDRFMRKDCFQTEPNTVNARKFQKLWKATSSLDKSHMSIHDVLEIINFID